MKVSELTAIIEALAPEIRAYVADELKTLSARLESIESTKAAPIPGPPGERGADGVQGEKGIAGADGAPGEVGPRGEPGEPGPAGPPGETGPVGPAGPAGADGAPGRDGRDGLAGVQGEKGLDGRNGIDGRDGLTPDDFDFTFDPETRGLTIVLKHDGAVVKSVTKELTGLLLERGTFDDTKQYAPGDVVIFHGSSWIAKTVTSAQPDLSRNGNHDWRLLAQRGRDGKQGLQGLKGMDGKDGRPGRDLSSTTARF